MGDLFDLPDPLPHFDGETYDPGEDYVRLGRQANDVWRTLVDNRTHWLTLHLLAELTGHPEASVSARLRDFRKEKFGAHEVLRRRVEKLVGRGLHEYRLVVNWNAPEMKAP